jgi:hypothetical protein
MLRNSNCPGCTMRDEPVEELEMGAPQEIIIVVFGAD